MATYEELLEEARSKVVAFQQTTAKEYIPKMYEAVRSENPNHTPEDIRERITKDCIKIWKKRTILEALPDEAKDPEKQKAGHLGQKKRNSEESKYTQRNLSLLLVSGVIAIFTLSLIWVKSK
jgi:hypothetical protein